MTHRSKLAILLGVLVAAVFVSTFGFFFFRDNFSTHYPIKFLAAQIWRGGELPYWNFYAGGGQPLAGNPNTLSFYPDNVLYLFLPPHVAFNLHFLIHLALGWLAMRALARSNAAAWLYVLSGAVVSATAFYNIVCGVALIPFALLAAERRRSLQLGFAFGLLALAGEPVTIVGAALAVLIVIVSREDGEGSRNAMQRISKSFAALRMTGAAIPIAIVIALPQLIAYSEIAREVERAHGYSATTVLNASLSPLRLLEFVVPLFAHDHFVFIYLTLFIGPIALAALLQRSRYTIVALTMLFLALGDANPIVRAIVEALPSIRVLRFPEKFALPMTVAICVLAAPLLRRRVWRWLTFVPLVLVALFTIPVDWWSPYALPPVQPRRIYHSPSDVGGPTMREEYRRRAQHHDPLFGATLGLRYALGRSPEGMYSLMTRIAQERYLLARQRRWREIALLPRAFIVPQATAARGVRETVERVEAGVPFVAPIDFRSPADARVTSFFERPQSLEIDVVSSAPALLFVNETYFSAWDAGGLRTLPIDLDRLGVIVPAGKTHVVLRFGRHRTAVAVTWLFSTLAIVAALFELVYRRAGEVERAGDDDAVRV